MCADFRVYLRDRENGKIMQYMTTALNFTDLDQIVIDLMLKHSDMDFECVRVRLVEIWYFKDINN